MAWNDLFKNLKKNKMEVKSNDPVQSSGLNAFLQNAPVKNTAPSQAGGFPPPPPPPPPPLPPMSGTPDYQSPQAGTASYGTQQGSFQDTQPFSQPVYPHQDQSFAMPDAQGQPHASTGQAYGQQNYNSENFNAQAYQPEAFQAQSDMAFQAQAGMTFQAQASVTEEKFDTMPEPLSVDSGEVSQLLSQLGGASGSTFGAMAFQEEANQAPAFQASTEFNPAPALQTSFDDMMPTVSGNSGDPFAVFGSTEGALTMAGSLESALESLDAVTGELNAAFDMTGLASGGNPFDVFQGDITQNHNDAPDIFQPASSNAFGNDPMLSASASFPDPADSFPISEIGLPQHPGLAIADPSITFEEISSNLIASNPTPPPHTPPLDEGLLQESKPSDADVLASAASLLEALQRGPEPSATLPTPEFVQDMPAQFVQDMPAQEEAFAFQAEDLLASLSQASLNQVEFNPVNSEPLLEAYSGEHQALDLTQDLASSLSPLDFNGLNFAGPDLSSLNMAGPDFTSSSHEMPPAEFHPEKSQAESQESLHNDRLLSLLNQIQPEQTDSSGVDLESLCSLGFSSEAPVLQDEQEQAMDTAFIPPTPVAMDYNPVRLDAFGPEFGPESFNQPGHQASPELEMGVGIDPLNALSNTAMNEALNTAFNTHDPLTASVNELTMSDMLSPQIEAPLDTVPLAPEFVSQASEMTFPLGDVIAPDLSPDAAMPLDAVGLNGLNLEALSLDATSVNFDGLLTHAFDDQTFDAADASLDDFSNTVSSSEAQLAAQVDALEQALWNSPPVEPSHHVEPALALDSQPHEKEWAQPHELSLEGTPEQFHVPGPPPENQHHAQPHAATHDVFAAQDPNTALLAPVNSVNSVNTPFETPLETPLEVPFEAPLQAQPEVLTEQTVSVAFESPENKLEHQPDQQPSLSQMLAALASATMIDTPAEQPVSVLPLQESFESLQQPALQESKSPQSENPVFEPSLKEELTQTDTLLQPEACIITSDKSTQFESAAELMEIALVEPATVPEANHGENSEPAAPQPVSRIKPGFPLRPRVANVPEPPKLTYDLDSNSDAYQHALSDTLSSSISEEMRKMQTDAIQERNQFTRKSVDSLVSRYFEMAQHELENDD